MSDAREFVHETRCALLSLMFWSVLTGATSKSLNAPVLLQLPFSCLALKLVIALQMACYWNSPSAKVKGITVVVGTAKPMLSESLGQLPPGGGGALGPTVAGGSGKAAVGIACIMPATLVQDSIVISTASPAGATSVGCLGGRG
ncbi:hypothetical protein B0T26DRAFT_680850 [Lasiosphaeria miniovina]|uniref:Uncharacterized protein n=1 Tax=Lasiosphaeria miniovina TaxID=1954250 RepID=A0AA39ZSZ9_9PEZI|nr:uncharacterized protein B0T26DRAFT_680850 [Lasiosphaeria miniovina]KAK0703109.1 hypothetical protein B0T26DRAFT_680850 [Lasiosphaeria miniovina]